MDWLTLTLICAFFLASADAATKKFLSDYSAAELVVVRLVWTALLVGPLLLWLPWPPLPAAFWGWVALLLPFELIAMVLYMQAIRESPLAHTLPYLAFTPVFNVLTAQLVLGERVSLQGLAGILIVAIGAYTLNLDRTWANGQRSLTEPFKFILRERGPRLMLAVAFLYSITSTLGKGAVAQVPAAFFGPFYFSLLGAIALSIAATRDPRGCARLILRRPAAHLLVGATMAVMAVSHFLAIQKVEVAYMIAVKRSSLIFGILYGALLFGEQRLAQHLAVGALMVLGILLIAFGH